jgi:hypothetical protein
VARDVVYPLIVRDCFGVRYMAQIDGVLTGMRRDFPGAG